MKLKKFIFNIDIITLIIGVVILYFSENIVLWFYPLDSIPSSVLSMLLYFTLYTIAIFGIFKGVVYLIIRVYWNGLYQYFEKTFNNDFKELTKIQRVCVSLGFYSVLLFFLAAIFRASISAL